MLIQNMEFTYINDVVIVPDIYHGNLGVSHSKETLREPHRVPVEVELLKFVLHRLGEGCVVFLQGILGLGPLLEQCRLPHCSIVVYLITSTEHDVERPVLVCVQHIAPQWIWPAELTRVHTEGETVAAVEHNVHRLALGWNPEPNGRTMVNLVRNAYLCAAKLDLEVETPEGDSTFGVQTNTTYLSKFAKPLTIFLVDASRPSPGRTPILREDTCIILDARQVFILGNLIHWFDVQSFSCSGHLNLAFDGVNISRIQVIDFHGGRG
jgi:hypothetical protein